MDRRKESSENRRFPRAKERIPVKVYIHEDKKQFEATVYTTDISLSGVFFSTNFYLKPGTIMDLEFKMPNDDRTVRVRGIIIREVRLHDRGPTRSTVKAGFAMRFIEFFKDAKAILASSFLIAGLDEFLEDYLKRRSKKPRNETEGLRDVIIAWEVAQMDVTGGELDIMKDRISVDADGRIRRRRG